MQFTSCERQILSRLSACVVFVNIIRLITGKVRYALSNLGCEHAYQHRVNCTDHREVQIPPFLALLLASFFVGTMMGMGPLDMVNAIESGIGGTLGFLAAVIGLGTILGK